MESKITIKLTNRSKKTPLKKLPDSLTVPSNATVQDAKIIIARETRTSDWNRIGLFDPATNSTLKDRNALLRDVTGVISKGEMLVKDLGTSHAALPKLPSATMPLANDWTRLSSFVAPRLRY
jgi:very-long-chain enoyl-CoA reductase